MGGAYPPFPPKTERAGNADLAVVFGELISPAFVCKIGPHPSIKCGRINGINEDYTCPVFCRCDI